MTPEESQLLTALADRIRGAPAQARDTEAEQALRQLTQERPDTAYLLAQTVLMQDFALRNAQAQITDLQSQLEAARQQPAPPQNQGSFLGGLFGGGNTQRAPGPAPSTVPSVSPWTRSNQQGYAPPPPPNYGQPNYVQANYAQPQPVYGAPVMQPSQTSGFLRGAAQTAVGIAGGALLFEGVQSLFSGHQGMGGFGGSPWGGGGGMMPTESLSETTVVNNYYGDGGEAERRDSDYQQGTDSGGFQNADYDPNLDPSQTPDQDFGSDDSFGGDTDDI